MPLRHGGEQAFPKSMVQYNTLAGPLYWKPTSAFSLGFNIKEMRGRANPKGIFSGPSLDWQLALRPVKRH